MDLIQLRFDAVEQLSGSQSISETMAILKRFGEAFDYDKFLICGMPEVGTEVSKIVLVNEFPPEWLEIYDTSGYIRYDLVTQTAVGTRAPVRWRDLEPRWGDRGTPVREFMQEAIDIGLSDGYTVPIFSPGGRIAAVNFATAGVRPVDRATGSALSVVGTFAFQQICSFMGPINLPQAKLLPLSTRELDCLSWAAEGECAAEISARLGLSPRTVEEYLCNVRRKLKAANTAQAIAKAFRLGIMR